MPMREHTENAYFAASNSYRGFISYFDEIFRREEIKHLYIIKGGPGTGKSRFMREVGESAAALGKTVEYYYCSSDQSSLDGVIIYSDDVSERSAIAIIDGTAPHSYDTVCPGAKEEIINLGQFWKSDILCGYGEEITKLGEKKSHHYTNAYSYLSASHSIKTLIDKHVLQYCDTEKMNEFVEDSLKDIEFSKGCGRVLPSLIDSIGTLGEVRYDSFSPNAEHVLCITDFCDSSALIFGRFFEKLHNLGIDLRVSYDPIEPDTINGIITEDGRFAVIKCDIDGDIEKEASVLKTYSCRKFSNFPSDKKEKSLVRHLIEMRNSLITLALSELGEAGRAHFDIESIYISAMDFDAKEKFSKKFRDELLSGRFF